MFGRYQGQTDLYAIEPDGSNLTQLTDTPTRWEWNPVVAPDGTLILYERGGDDGYRVTDLFTISAGGESRTRLSDTPRRWEAFPDWQPLVTG